MISLFIMQNCHAATKAAEMAGRHMPHMRFFGTNWWDVKIAFFICAAITIIAVVFIITQAILAWKKRKLDTLITPTKKVELEMLQAKLKAQIEKEKVELQAKIEKEKSELPNVYFKEICTASKNEDGVVDIETVKQLFELYQKNNSGNSES